MRRILVLFTMLAVLAGCRGARHEPAPAIGQVTQVEGDVTVRRGDVARAEPVVSGLVVTRDMVFVTAPEASLEVRFDNGSKWKLGGGREQAIAQVKVAELPAPTAEPPAPEAGPAAAAPPSPPPAPPGDAAPEPDKPMAPEVPVVVPEDKP